MYLKTDDYNGGMGWRVLLVLIIGGLRLCTGSEWRMTMTVMACTFVLYIHPYCILDV